MPGALSAFGILVSDVVKDNSRTVLWRVAAKLPEQQVEKEFATLRRQAEGDFRNEAWKGAINHRRSVDLRYQGQGYELNIPYSGDLISNFRREHQRRYGFSYPERDVELVSLRLRSMVKAPQSKITAASTTTAT